MSSIIKTIIIYRIVSFIFSEIIFLESGWKFFFFRGGGENERRQTRWFSRRINNESKSSWVAANRSRGELIQSRIFLSLILVSLLESAYTNGIYSYVSCQISTRVDRRAKGNENDVAAPVKAERIDHTWWEFHFYWRDKKMRKGLSAPPASSFLE